VSSDQPDPVGVHPTIPVTTRLHVVNVPPAGRLPLQKAIEAAERYYTDSKYRTALDEVLATEAKER
jgi:hypothetical protein